MSHQAYLSLGSNIEPEHNLVRAVQGLAEYGTVQAVSSVWESPAVGRADQPHYLNACVLLSTELSASALRFEAIAALEASLGRMRVADKFAPRPIDIDVMLFNHDQLTLGQRHIPDPEILERAFVAIPLAEIAPDYVHPETGQSLHAIAQTFSTVALRRRPDIQLQPVSLSP